MKKDLLFVIESLAIGGAEKSLVTLLNLIDYSQYNVDLLLFSQGGPFQSLLPGQVNILPEPDYFHYSSIGWKQLGAKLREPRKLVAQLTYSLELRLKKSSNIEKAVLLWRACRNCISGPSKEYDVAIAYAQGAPTFFVADKVKAKKKAAWINVTYIPKGFALDFIAPYYERFDIVNAVSASVREQMQATFHIPDSKVMVMKDILNADFAHKMAKMESTVIADMAYSGVKILTVGRLAAMKGYDLAVEAAKLLRDKGIDFCWYAVGDGSMREALEAKIREYHLEKEFVLLGSRINPYPYFAACDLYVQPSKYEGFGITLAEAKMFCKPIVVTNFDAVGAQFENEKNGLIVDISAEAIACGVERMLGDGVLQSACVDYLQKEKIGNTGEIETLYRWIEA